MMTRIAACALLVLPAAALADCPTADDLEKGILFHVDGGDREVFRRFSDDVISSVYSYGDGGPESRFLLGRGMYLLETTEVENGVTLAGSKVVYAFEMGVDEMPLPTPEAGWTTDVIVREGTFLDTETQIYSFGPQTQVSFGACTYDMIPVIQSYRPDPDEVVEYVNWLPELGISYLVRASYPDGDDRYVYNRIEALN